MCVNVKNSLAAVIKHSAPISIYTVVDFLEI